MGSLHSKNKSRGAQRPGTSARASSSSTLLTVPGSSSSNGGRNVSSHQQHFENRLHRFYSHYAPQKLPEVPHLAASYLERQEFAFERLVTKYGPEPQQQQQQQQPVLGVAVASDNFSTTVLVNNNTNNSSFASSSANSSFGYNINNNSTATSGLGYPEEDQRQPQKNGSVIVPKYIRDSDGVRRLNPEFIRPRGGAQNVAFPLSHFDTNAALPVVSTVNEARALPDGALASSTVATLEMLKEHDVVRGAGFATPQDMCAGLQQLLARFEIPLGLANKLLSLSEFDAIDVLIDNSGSMRLPSTHTSPSADTDGASTTAARSGSISRWDEVRERLFVMFEVLVHVPCPPVCIHFMNGGYQCTLHMNTPDRTTTASSSSSSYAATLSPPYMRLLSIREKLTNLFASKRPMSTTPAFRFIADAITKRSAVGERVPMFFFGDGEPNGGAAEAKQISRLLVNRPNAQQNPFTFLSCTDDDAATQWMKECEEVAPYCAEYDDFVTESKEVLLDQGKALPYTYGVYLISQLVGAMNPEDLDAMDESIPFCKRTLENLNGYTMSDREYRYYFGCFMEAQRNRSVESPADRIKKERSWGSHYSTFLRGDRCEMARLTASLRSELAATIL